MALYSTSRVLGIEPYQSKRILLDTNRKLLEAHYILF